MLSADGSGTACFSACRRIPLADRRRKRLGSSFGSETTLTSSSPNDTIHYAIAAGQDDGVDSNGLLVVFPGCRVVGGSTNPCNYNESTMRSDLLLWQKVESTTTGPQVVNASSNGQTINDSVSIVVRESGFGTRRFILFNG